MDAQPTESELTLSNAMLEGKFCLRVCIVNHLTKDSDIEAVLPEVLAAAAEVALPTRSKT